MVDLCPQGVQNLRESMRIDKRYLKGSIKGLLTKFGQLSSKKMLKSKDKEGGR